MTGHVTDLIEKNNEKEKVVCKSMDYIEIQKKFIKMLFSVTKVDDENKSFSEQSISLFCNKTIKNGKN